MALIHALHAVQGAAIMAAVAVVVLVTAVNNYQKEQQFRALNQINDDVKVRKPTVTLLIRSRRCRPLHTYGNPKTQNSVKCRPIAGSRRQKRPGV
jgi:hypothetical protein